MGFTSGFAGGVTVTLAIAYFSIITHERNRQAQALGLRQSSRTLNSLFEPQPPLGPTRAELLRAERSSFVEYAKDRWNQEIQKAMRALQNTDWEEIRQKRDEAFSKILGEGVEATQYAIEQAEKNIQETTAVVGEKTERSAEQAKEKAAAAAARASTKASQVKEQASAKTSRIKDEVPAKVDQLKTEVPKATAGTVDTARGAVRDAVSRGIEKGRELVGKAQDAVGGVARTKEEVKEAVIKSEVERALEERYKPLSGEGLDRSPEEVLAERYQGNRLI